MKDKTSARVNHVAVVGGGIAAFAARRCLRTAGFRVLAIEGAAPPVAPERLLVCPRLQRGESLHARFLRDAYQEACAFYEQAPHDKAIVARGALRLAQNAQEQERFRALAQELPHLCRWLDANEAQQKSGLLKDATPWRAPWEAPWGGVFLPDAIVLAPRRLFAKSETGMRASLARMTREADGCWRLFVRRKEAEAQKEEEEEVVRAEAVVLALGAHLPAFLPTFLRRSVFSPSLSPSLSSSSSPSLSLLLQNLQMGRGRLDVCDGAALSCPPLLPVCGSGWVMPFPRGRIGVVRGLAPSRAELGEQENRKRLVQWCGMSEGARFETPYEGSRLTTRDRLPLLGEWDCFGGQGSSGLFLFGALGGHGFLSAPLCAKGLVGLLRGGEGAQDGLAFLSPQRFLS